MKVRRAFISSLAIGAILVPSAAIADDVHITIGTRHVTRDGAQKLKVAGYLHPISGSCTDNRHVVIQRRTADGWKGLGHAMTNGEGRYSKVVGDKTGRYRTLAPKSGSCERDLSEVKRHRH
jgi:hypothetical protein